MAGIKFDSSKPRLGLIDPAFLEGMAFVLGFGEDKYGGPNWLEGLDYSRLLDAAKRHIMAVERGENTDPETGMNHTLHAACCLMFLNHYMENSCYDRFDDRRFTGYAPAITKKDLLDVQGGEGTDGIRTKSGAEKPLDMQKMCQCGEDKIAEAQQRIKNWADRVYPERTAHGALVKLMLEEIPELLNGGLDDPGEYADTLILLLDIAEMRGIDAIQAVHDKMKINEERSWKIDPLTKIMRHV